jgi:Uma2 family endonuclease
MTTVTRPFRANQPPPDLTPEDVERASERDGKRYELIDGELREKIVGTKALFVASRICERLHSVYYPSIGFAAVEAMIYCFNRRRHGRKPDVVYLTFERLDGVAIPDGDILVVPDLVVEVLSPGHSGIEIEEKLNEHLEAGIPLVWIVNPDQRTIRSYRNDGSTRLFREKDAIENEPGLPGFRMVVGEVFPVGPQPGA